MVMLPVVMLPVVSWQPVHGRDACGQRGRVALLESFQPPLGGCARTEVGPLTHRGCKKANQPFLSTRAARGHPGGQQQKEPRNSGEECFC